MAPACTPETIERIATLLKDTNLHDLLSPQNVIILKDSATVEQSLKVRLMTPGHCHQLSTPAVPTHMQHDLAFPLLLCMLECFSVPTTILLPRITQLCSCMQKACC